VAVGIIGKIKSVKYLKYHLIFNFFFFQLILHYKYNLIIENLSKEWNEKQRKIASKLNMLNLF
jgi:hypothetical protein